MQARASREMNAETPATRHLTDGVQIPPLAILVLSILPFPAHLIVFGSGTVAGTARTYFYIQVIDGHGFCP